MTKSKVPLTYLKILPLCPLPPFQPPSSSTTKTPTIKEGNRMAEGSEKLGVRRNKRPRIGAIYRDKVPEDVATMFDEVDLKTLQRNPFVFLTKITDLGTTLLQRKAKR